MEAAAKALISQLKRPPDFGGEYGIAIADAAGNVVAEHDLDKSYTPGIHHENADGVHAAATTPDMGSTLDTQTYLEQREDGTARLVLKGNGDMPLGAGESDSAHINGRRAGNAFAANTVRRCGSGHRARDACLR